MSSRSGGGPQFNIGSLSGVFYYAGQNISGKHSHHIRHGQPSDSQLISCLQEVLDSPDVPWSNPELSDVRQVMEKAITQQNPHIFELKQALMKLRDVCSQVAVGVLGNGAYQLLSQYFL
ncbi:hypothetical protein GCM10023196_083350 [Actinoallomurus vinaceus]|uniref:Uncharacterized protein n=1 Tax=Actinoallomurus vinaceus TaxID=1080074 RepID=A0ABP8UNW0_9ACTN